MQLETSKPNRPTTWLGSGRRASRALFATGVAIALLAGGCSDDDGDGAAQTTVAPEIGDAASIESSTSTTDSAPVTTTTTVVPTGAPDPEAAAAALYDAWKANDPTAGASVAEAAAVEAMSTVAPGDYSLYNRCNTGEFGQSTCLYRGDPGTIQFSMQDRDGAWVVTTAIFSPA